MSILKRLKNIQHIAISRCLYNRLTAFKVPATLIDFNLVNTNIFKPISQPSTSKSIYIYSGHPVNKGGNSSTYGKPIYQQIMKKLPQFQYFLSHTVNVPHEQMPTIYGQCFIALRLTEYDGNANTVQECEAMQIPIIHNGSDYGLKWKTKNDVIHHILCRSS